MESNSTTKQRPGSSKVDPSFKSKRYRDKLRTEIKALEALIPVDRSALHRKLDSQTVFRLVIAYFRTKMFLEAAGLERGKAVSQSEAVEKKPDLAALEEQQEPPEVATGHELLQAMDGFLLVITSDGTILYVTQNILHHLGFNQIDLMHRCMYGIVHPDDHYELKVVLEQTLSDCRIKIDSQQQRPCCMMSDETKDRCKTVSFLCRMKCFNGTTTGYLKMHCMGHMRAFSQMKKSNRTSSQVMFTFCRPFISLTNDPKYDARSQGFWSKHELDLRFKAMDKRAPETIGYSLEELEGVSFYQLVHPQDLAVFTACHKTLIQTEEIQTMYFRMSTKDGVWIWLHTRGKVVFKNSKKYSIVFTHCPVREEDSTYIQQEVALRQKYAIQDAIMVQNSFGSALSPSSIHWLSPNGPIKSRYNPYCSLPEEEGALHSPHGQCPSSWHANSERHSPVFPSTHLPHKFSSKDRCWHPDLQRRRGLEQALELHKRGAVSSQLVTPQPSVSQLLAPQPSITQQLLAPQPSTAPSPWNCQLPNQAKQYWMHFNGVGIAPPPRTVAGLQPSSTTMFFHGQVTAYEANQASFLPSCQFMDPRNQGCDWQGNSSSLLSPPPSPVQCYKPAMSCTDQPCVPLSPLLDPFPACINHVDAGDFPVKEERPFSLQNLQRQVHSDVSTAVQTLSMLSSASGRECYDTYRSQCVFTSPADDCLGFPPCHMTVVDNQPKVPCSTSNIDLPSIGSFLEYLHDG